MPKFDDPGYFVPAIGPYKGDMLEGVRHGKGLQTWFYGPMLGCQFTGTWVKGIAAGFGKLEKPDGTVLEGTWKDNKLHGRGVVCRFANGDL